MSRKVDPTLNKAETTTINPQAVGGLFQSWPWPF